MIPPTSPPMGREDTGQRGDQAVRQVQPLSPCGTDPLGLDSKTRWFKSTEPNGTLCILVRYANGAERSAGVPGAPLRDLIPLAAWFPFPVIICSPGQVSR